jgi:exo-beta-1,3-glucanase (GH17 family)
MKQMLALVLGLMLNLDTLLFGFAVNGDNAYTGNSIKASATVTYTLSGLNFGPFVDGQDPNFGSQVSEAQLRERMQIIAPYTNWVRTFGCTGGLERAGLVAHSLNLQVALGAWLSRDLAANELEISNLISAAQSGQADMAIVGSEVLRRGDLSATQLIEYINRVRQAIPAGIPVSTGEVYGLLIANPSVISAVNLLMVNFYPYWEGSSIDTAIALLHGRYQQVAALAGGKTIIVSETGWPSCGNTVGAAIPSPENASFYFLNFISWARANNVSYFYFSALDESWKANHEEGPQGACFGIWNKNGILKPGMQNVFDGQTITDNWSGNSIPGGPGTPSIEFTSVPRYGSFDDLQGQIWHVKPVDYKVVAYIRVFGGWWIKPTFTNPQTLILPNGKWTCDITTGGVDQKANRIATYVIPNAYNPPLLSGSSTLPAELDQNSVAKVETPRSFADVSPTDWAGRYIEALYANGITLGCAQDPPLYCPDAQVTREQMAAFIMRARGEFNPPTPAFQRFADVPPGNPFYAFIERMGALGITLGCGNNRYCPDQSVTREQMAAFMIRALGVFSPPSPSQQRFGDVPPTNQFYGFIEEMAARQITLGCSATPPLYCPSDIVTRAQMAVFLVRAFGL